MVVRGDCYNRDAFNELCEITRNTSTLLRLHGDYGPLKESIYGTKGRIALFTEDGKVDSPWGCTSGISGRSVYCNHYAGNPGFAWSFGRNGCFAESLVGAMVCICAPGKAGPTNLCGVSDVGSGKRWSGNFNGGRIDNALLKDLWLKVIKNCTEGNKSEQGYAEEFEYLKEYLKNIRRKIHKGSGFFYFGGENGKTVCGAEKAEDVCARYQGRNDNEANIPWADKIEKALEQMKPAIYQSRARRTLVQATKVPSAQRSNGKPVELEEVAKVKEPVVQTEATSQKTDEQPDGKESQTENIRSPSTPEQTPYKRTKRNTQTTPLSDMPHLATDVNNESSLMTKPLWLLLVAILH
ncbi:unnamed protein product [Trypanosoma congolense IL3000]|uniref:WGS project CAEQ00000000 data, annotated contig 67 n=1 Tax=Trypanosoma congolense (strain IL3000) TaxID=1068625 RepID=F9WHN6_TRYCI|nr:unnamed protein product [Trypanosoma congolense IL3000]